MGKNIHEEVRAYYGNIARHVTAGAGRSCCKGASCCGDTAKKQTSFYSAEEIAGVPEEAIQASLGCANPIVLANLQKGETVLDLGSGGGIDVLISAKLVGENGKAYGLDMTDEMLALAHQNLKKSGAKNVEFIKGYIEHIPLGDETVDVVTSNCVINLTENKEVALREAYRVLRKGGRLAIADIVALKPVPDALLENIQMWVGCIAGALSMAEYERILRAAGFTGVEITPVNVYTKEAIESLAQGKQMGDFFSKHYDDVLDGAFAGAQVKAKKE